MAVVGRGQRVEDRRVHAGGVVAGEGAGGGVHVLDTMAVPVQHLHQVRDSFHRHREWLHVGDLRADVYTYAFDPEISVPEARAYSFRASAIGIPNLC